MRCSGAGVEQAWADLFYLTELVINRKAASDLGVNISQSLLRRADAVVD